MVGPVFQSSTFVNPVAWSEEFYTRHGNNPEPGDSTRKYALLEGAEAAVFPAGDGRHRPCPPGGAAGRGLPGQRVIYGGTWRLFDDELGRFGIEVV